MECEKVPESFPGTVAIKEDIARNTLLHKDYRRYKNGPDADFEYFVTRLLAKLNPLRTNFRMKKKEHLISDIFTASDEAFVLFVLYNELECWEAQREDMKKGMSGRKLVKVKRFCNGTSGKREAWSEKGMLIYRTSTEQVLVNCSGINSICSSSVLNSLSLQCRSFVL